MGSIAEPLLPIPTSTHALFSLANHTIAITGAVRGLGITLAAAVLESGGHAACIDLLPLPSSPKWSSLQKLALSASLSLTYHTCDITHEHYISATLDKIAEAGKERGAKLAGVIACAGIQQKIPAADYPVEGFRRIMDVNVTGMFLTIKHSARIFMREETRGSVVMIASMSGQVANRVCHEVLMSMRMMFKLMNSYYGLTCTAHNTWKAAVHQMCRSVAQQWGAYGIRVNTLSPGYIRTAMTDELLLAEPEVEKTWMAGALLGRLGVPEDFKAPAVFLLADGSSWMTGADLRVDGGHCASA